MVDAIRHRGPDGTGHFVSDERSPDMSVGLGHCRLAIRDLSDAGAQPMSSPTGTTTMVYNGEIYNDDAIEAELHKATGFRRKGHCDAEIVPEGFAVWGLDLFERLNGMFAIAVWDATHQRLILARDHVGIKPLFYSDDGVTVRFASEVKGLLADPGQSRAVDGAQLHSYLAQGYPDPNASLLSGVRQVPPGTAVVFDRDGSSTHRWWAPSRGGRIRDMREALDRFADLWPRVLSEHLVSDVPITVLQSGGIDSSLISAGLARSARPTMITARFASKDHDESGMAEAVAASLGSAHHIVDADAQAGADDIFRNIAWQVDGQLADSSAYAFLQVARAARSRSTVALTGDGADEFFGGYPTLTATRVADRLKPLAPKSLAQSFGRFCLSRAARHTGRRAVLEDVGRFAMGLPAACPHAQWRRLLMERDSATLYGPSLRDHMDTDPLSGYAAAYSGAKGSSADKALLADQTHYLPGDLLAKSDLMSMAQGLEIRVPFLDRRMLALAGELDVALLQRLGQPGKRVLRCAGETLGLPRQILAGRKRGFNVPAAQLLRTALRPLAERYLVAQGEALSDHFDAGGVRVFWQDHLAGRRNNAYALWALLVFAVWYQDHLNARPSLARNDSRTGVSPEIQAKSHHAG